MTVTGLHHGGTSYHERFVFTQHDLRIVKTNAATEVILRKTGDRIDVVELQWRRSWPGSAAKADCRGEARGCDDFS